jgi:hypothetical protein
MSVKNYSERDKDSSLLPLRITYIELLLIMAVFILTKANNSTVNNQGECEGKCAYVYFIYGLLNYTVNSQTIKG